jgi:hypothetical protein
MRTVIALLASSVTFVAAHADELPFRPATPWEVSFLVQGGVVQPGVIATPLNQTSFSTAATVTVHKLTDTSLAPSSTQRNFMALSHVYKPALSAGSPTPIAVLVPNAPPAPPTPMGDTSGLMDYPVTPNSVQAWATMSELGAPFLFVYTNGQSKGQSAASWSTQYTVPGSGNRDVYVQLAIPLVQFKGRWEDGAPSVSRARMRMDFLVNGYPAWSTESIRVNEVGTDLKEKAVFVETFGNSIGLQALDSINAVSSAQTVTIKLGTYLAGTVLDLSQLFQVEGQVDSVCVPEVTKDGQPILDEDSKLQENYCGGVLVKIDWNPAAPQPTFYSKTAPLQ